MGCRIETSTHSKTRQVFVEFDLAIRSVLARPTVVPQGEMVVHPVGTDM